MNKKNRQLITKWAVYGALAFTAASCVVGIGTFGVSLNAQIIDKLGWERFAAACMAVWMMYMVGARKKRMFQWVYVAVTLIFIGAALSTIQPGAFGAISANIIKELTPDRYPAIGPLAVWIIAAGLLIIPAIHDITLDSVRGMVSGKKPGTGGGFSFPALAAAAPTSSTEPPSTGYRPIPFVRFESLASDKAFMKSRFTFPVGQKEDSKPLCAELSDDTPHFLIAGATGSGKTVFLQTLIAALAYKNSPEDLQLILIDGLRWGLKPLCCLPHVIHNDVISKDDDMVKAVNWLYDRMDERINGERRICKPKIVVVIDETDRYYSTPRVKKAVAAKIDTIVKDGRQLGIHLILGSQKPGGDLIPTHTLSQMTRICMKVNMPRFSESIIDCEDGASLTGKGDLLYLLDGNLVHARGYFMDEEGKGEVSDFAAGIARMYPPAPKILEADAADRDAAGADEGSGIDLFIPGKTYSGKRFAGSNNRAGELGDGPDLFIPFEREARVVNFPSYTGRTAPDTRADSRTAPDTHKPHETAERTAADSVRGRTADSSTDGNTYKTGGYMGADADGRTPGRRDTVSQIIALHRANKSSRDIAPLVGMGKTKVAEIIKKYEEGLGEIEEG